MLFDNNLLLYYYWFINTFDNNFFDLLKFGLKNKAFKDEIAYYYWLFIKGDMIFFLEIIYLLCILYFNLLQSFIGFLLLIYINYLVINLF